VFGGIKHFELLPRNQTINADVYCHQLECLRIALVEKRPALVNRNGVLIHGNKARLHTASSNFFQRGFNNWLSGVSVVEFDGDYFPY